MLWYKLCVLILLSDNVFGFWNNPPNEISTVSFLGRPTRGKSVTLMQVPTDPATEEPAVETSTGMSSRSDEETTTSEEKTTTEVTTNTEETTITEEPPTSTESPAVCNTSLHTKEDLLLIFNYFENNLKIHENIIDSFYSEALNIKKKHLDEIEDFKKLFQDKPMHLKHILEHIRKTRQQFLPYVEDILESLNQYPELENQYQKNNENLVLVFTKFEKQILLCRLICGKEDYFGREMILKEDLPYDKNEFYCGSIAEVHNEIQSKLANFSAYYQKFYQDKLNLDDVKYGSEIKQLKIKLKDFALKEFGHTMYDILELQDSYFHFAEAIKNGAISDILKNATYNIAQMRLKNLEFENAIQELANYCISCSNNNFVLRQSDPTKEDTSDKPSSGEYSNLLDEVMKAQLQHLEESFDEIYTSIFEDLVEAIEEANSTNAYIDDIRPILDEIAAETEQEYHELANLKQMIPMDYYHGMTQLIIQSKDTLEQIDAYINIIHQSIK